MHQYAWLAFVYLRSRLNYSFNEQQQSLLVLSITVSCARAHARIQRTMQWMVHALNSMLQGQDGVGVLYGGYTWQLCGAVKRGRGFSPIQSLAT